MDVDFNQVLVNLDGTALKRNEVARDGTTVSEDLKLGHVAIEALMVASDPKEKGGPKLTRYEIAIKIKAAMKADGLLDLAHDDIGVLKNAIGDGFGPLVVGQAWQILDPKPKPKEIAH